MEYLCRAMSKHALKNAMAFSHCVFNQFSILTKQHLSYVDIKHAIERNYFNFSMFWITHLAQNNQLEAHFFEAFYHQLVNNHKEIMVPESKEMIEKIWINLKTKGKSNLNGTLNDYAENLLTALLLMVIIDDNFSNSIIEELKKNISLLLYRYLRSTYSNSAFSRIHNCFVESIFKYKNEVNYQTPSGYTMIKTRLQFHL